MVVSLCFFRKQSVTLETELQGKTENKQAFFPFCQQFIYFGQPPNNSSRPQTFQWIESGPPMAL
jgi:hypothetical protein